MTLEDLYRRVYEAQRVRMSKYMDGFNGHGSCGPNTILVWSDRYEDRNYQNYTDDEKVLIRACLIYRTAKEEGLDRAMLFKLTMGL